MGNGNKAAMKREANAAKGAKTGPTSQLKANAAALTIQCDICKQSFMGTTKLPGLQEHVSARHAGKEVSNCFPNWTPPAATGGKGKK
ncbi:DUF1909-domain-containing protein [Meredithblackwellia eburnea MCA 4105]